MKCPACCGKIKYFSSFNFKLKKVKKCPNCSEMLQHSINIKYFVIGLTPVVGFQLYILGPAFFKLGLPHPFYVAQFLTSLMFYFSVARFKLADKPY